jgi:chaperonin GroEL
VFTDELDIKLERVTTDLLGSTGSITITKEDTIVLNGEGSKDSIQAHCEQIRSIIADPTTSEFDKKKLCTDTFIRRNKFLHKSTPKHKNYFV